MGALLIALAGVGVFVAYAEAARGPSDPVVITRNAIRPGETIEAGDLRLVTADLPSDVTGSFDDAELLVGRVALGPLSAGEIVQASAVTDDRAVVTGHEIALTLPREQVAVGRLKQGERVDVYVTVEDLTTSVVRGAQVVQIGSEGDGSLTSERQVSIVVAVSSADDVAGLVHALRTGEVTVVRSTFAAAGDGEPVSAGVAPEDDPEATDRAGPTGT